jgi:hypothetical protein
LASVVRRFGVAAGQSAMTSITAIVNGRMISAAYHSVLWKLRMRCRR